MNLLKTISGKKWGVDRKQLLRMYHVFIRSQLDYGCEIYGTAKPHQLKKLNSIQNQALRISTGAFCTRPVVNIHADANELSLSQHRDFKLIIFYASIWLNKININHYRTIHSPYKTTMVTPIGTKCRTLIQHYKVNLPQHKSIRRHHCAT